MWLLQDVPPAQPRTSANSFPAICKLLVAITIGRIGVPTLGTARPHLHELPRINVVDGATKVGCLHLHAVIIRHDLHFTHPILFELLRGALKDGRAVRENV